MVEVALPSGISALSALVDAVIRKAQVACGLSELSQELRAWKACMDEALHHGSYSDHDQEVAEFDGALWAVGAAIAQLASQQDVVKRTTLVLRTLENSLKEPMLSLLRRNADYQQFLRTWAPPGALQGAMADFWVSSFGRRQAVPSSIFQAVVLTHLQSHLAGSLEDDIMRRLQRFRGEHDIEEVRGSACAWLLGTLFDADGDGTVTVEEFNDVLQRCRGWAVASDSWQHLTMETTTLDDCLRISTQYEVVIQALPSEWLELTQLRLWLQPPRMRTKCLAMLAAPLTQASVRWLQFSLFAWQQGGTGDNESGRVCVLYGGPGLGKSTLAAAVLRRVPMDQAHHFCQYDDSKTWDPQLVMHSLALQLCARIPTVREKLLTLMNSNHTYQLFKDDDDAFQQLLAGPLATLSENTLRVVVLLDGLHEVPMKGDGTHPLVDLLCQHLLKLPAWVCFIVTTRPEQAIKKALANGLSTDATYIHAETPFQLRDMKEYVASALQDLGAPVGLLQQAADEVLSHSGHSFLHVTYTLKDLAASPALAKLRLKDVRASAAKGVAGVCAACLARHAAPGSAAHRQVTELLQLLAAAREPPTEPLLRRWLGTECFDACMQLLPELSSVIQHVGGIVRLSHKVVHDWLVRPGPQGYGIDPVAGHAKIAQWVVDERAAAGRSDYLLVHGPRHLALAAIAAANMGEWSRWTNVLLELFADAAFWSEVNDAWRCAASVRVLRPMELYLRVLAKAPQSRLLAQALACLAAHMVEQISDKFDKHVEHLYLRLLEVEESLGADGWLCFAGGTNLNVAFQQLATLYERQGRESDLEGLYQRALATFTDVAGPQDPLTASAMRSLAKWYRGKWRCCEAARLYEQAADTQRLQCGLDSWETASLTVTMATASLLCDDDREAALQVTRFLLEGQEQQYGSHHYINVVGLISLARQLHAKGDCEEATQLATRALAICQSHCDPEDPDTAPARTELAELFEEWNCTDEAVGLRRQVLAIQEKVPRPVDSKPADSPPCVPFSNILFSLLRKQGRHEDVLHLLLHRLEHLTRLLGADNPWTQVVRSHLATVLAEHGRHEEALLLRQQWLSICEQNRGPQDECLAEALASVASSLASLRRYHEALQLQRRAVAIYEAAFGGVHVIGLDSFVEMAKVQRILGHFDEAIALSKRILAIRDDICASLGHMMHVAASLLCMGQCLSAQGRHIESLQYLQQALEVYEDQRPSEPELLSQMHELIAGLRLCSQQGDNVLPLACRAAAVLLRAADYRGGRQQLDAALLSSLALYLHGHGAHDLAWRMFLYASANLKELGPETPEASAVLSDMSALLDSLEQLLSKQLATVQPEQRRVGELALAAARGLRAQQRYDEAGKAYYRGLGWSVPNVPAAAPGNNLALMPGELQGVTGPAQAPATVSLTAPATVPAKAPATLRATAAATALAEAPATAPTTAPAALPATAAGTALAGAPATAPAKALAALTATAAATALAEAPATLWATAAATAPAKAPATLTATAAATALAKASATAPAQAPATLPTTTTATALAEAPATAPAKAPAALPAMAAATALAEAPATTPAKAPTTLPATAAATALGEAPATLRATAAATAPAKAPATLPAMAAATALAEAPATTPAKAPATAPAKAPTTLPATAAATALAEAPATLRATAAATAPAKAPATLPATAPATALAKALATAPAKALATLPATAAATALAEAPATGPAKAPATAPATAPAKAPATAPAKAPVTAPAKAPVTAPAKAPATLPATAAATALAKGPTTAPETAPATATAKAPATATAQAPATRPATAATTAPPQAPVKAPSTTTRSSAANVSAAPNGIVSEMASRPGRGSSSAHIAEPAASQDALSAAAQPAAAVRTCSWCGSPSAAGTRLKLCAGCDMERYCSVACQKRHWRAGHNVACGQIAAAGPSKQARNAAG